jgi:hypothetical protein
MAYKKKADPYTFRCRGAGHVALYMIHRSESVNGFIFDQDGNLWGTFLTDFGCGAKPLQSLANSLFATFDYPELAPPIRRGFGLIGGSNRKSGVQKLAN